MSAKFRNFRVKYQESSIEFGTLPIFSPLKISVKVHPLTFEMELKGKLGQSSVNGLLNNSSSVNLLPLPDIMEVDSLREKMFQ